MLNINLGIKLVASIPVSLVESVSNKDPKLSKSVILDMSSFGTANTWITFREPVEVEIVLGFKKKVRAIALTVDRASDFHKALSN